MPFELSRAAPYGPLNGTELNMVKVKEMTKSNPDQSSPTRDKLCNGCGEAHLVSCWVRVLMALVLWCMVMLSFSAKDT